MYACTHAVVFANLILEGKPCGVHGFFLQLRDHEGRLMPGVEVGEIGPKLPHNHVNIGYARFNKVRVPRFNMFQKIFKVTREGKFIAPPPKVGKIKNISMMVMRVMNVSRERVAQRRGGEFTITPSSRISYRNSRDSTGLLGSSGHIQGRDHCSPLLCNPQAGLQGYDKARRWWARGEHDSGLQDAVSPSRPTNGSSGRGIRAAKLYSNLN